MGKSLSSKIKRIFNAGHNAEMMICAARRNELIDKALTSRESGVGGLCNGEEVVVSLTTYGKRLHDVALTVESIMQGSLKPSGIVLFLGDDLRGTTLPIALQNQMKRGLEVEYCKDVRSYTKIIPALRRFPDAVTVTVDDDAFYAFDLLENIIAEHQRHPSDVIAARMHRIVLDNKGMPRKYKRWERNAYPEDVSPLNFATGAGGVAYPPHSLPEETLNEDVFLSLCPYADDIWLYCMELLAGTAVRKCFTHSPIGEDLVFNKDVQGTGLRLVNNHSHKINNDTQLRAVLTRYRLYDKLKG